jgi:hypothetical protein
VKRILAVASSAPRYANGRPTELWIGELTHFAQVLDAHGVGLDVASIAGGRVPIDPVSEGWQGRPRAPTRAFYADEALETDLRAQGAAYQRATLRSSSFLAVRCALRAILDAMFAARSEAR